MSIPRLQHLWIRAHQQLLQGLAPPAAGDRPNTDTARAASPPAGRTARSEGAYALYDQVPENPSLTSVEAGLQYFRSQGCDSLIAVGGGSVIDCAKGIAARPANSWLSLRRMEGLFRVLRW